MTGNRPSRAAAPLFEDHHLDQRMRWIIPLLVRLAVLVTWASAPFLAPDTGRALATCLNALVALVATELLARLGVLARARRGAIGLLLAVLSVLVATGSLASGHPEAYSMLQALPVSFGAFFFSGRARFVLPVVAAAAEYLICRPTHSLSLAAAGVQLAVLLLLALFVVEVANGLREALTAHDALQSVLQAATDDPTEPTLTRRGLRAALAVTGWEAGAVLLADGGALTVEAAVGLPEEWADTSPGRQWALPAVPELLEARTAAHVADLAAVFGDAHLAAVGFAAVAVVPIRHHGRSIGVLLVAERTPRQLDDRERDRLDEVGAQLGLALGNARARRREQQVADELRELNRRKDEFLALISHELRTPATSIELGAQTLRRGAARLEAAERTEILDTIVSRSRELRDLVESVLTVALADSGDLPSATTPFDWVTSVRTWVNELTEQTGRTVTADLPTERVLTLADAEKVHRIVASLLSNAVKFSVAGTPVRVRLEADDDTVRVHVTDEGEGIAPELHDAVFDRFYQVDSGSTRRAGGLGLGLTVAQRLAHLCGGHIGVQSAPGQGSTFTLVVPRVPLPDSAGDDARTAPAAG